jgi:hypothetical protein
MKKFGVPYQQIYSWVRKYEEHGIDGLRGGMDSRVKGGSFKLDDIFFVAVAVVSVSRDTVPCR